MEKKKYYITTPIYYPSGKWHIGTCYTTIICDALVLLFVSARCFRAVFYLYYLEGPDIYGSHIFSPSAIPITTRKIQAYAGIRRILSYGYRRARSENSKSRRFSRSRGKEVYRRSCGRTQKTLGNTYNSCSLLFPPICFRPMFSGGFLFVLFRRGGFVIWQRPSKIYVF